MTAAANKPIRTIWTPDNMAMLRALYPHHTAEAVAKAIGCSIASVWSKARQLGVGKTPEFLASQRSGRIQRGQQSAAIKAQHFKPGHVCWNKGIQGSTGHHPNTVATQFKRGRPPADAHNYVPIGSLRTSRDGYLERKVNDTHPVPVRRWVTVHRLVWEAAHGAIPPKHIVVFKSGCKTTAEADITANKLDCISRAEHALRNHPRSKSPELAKLVQLKGSITRQVNRIAREHSAQQGQHP